MGRRVSRRRRAHRPELGKLGGLMKVVQDRNLLETDSGGARPGRIPYPDLDLPRPPIVRKTRGGTRRRVPGRWLPIERRRRAEAKAFGREEPTEKLGHFATVSTRIQRRTRL